MSKIIGKPQIKVSRKKLDFFSQSDFNTENTTTEKKPRKLSQFNKKASTVSISSAAHLIMKKQKRKLKNQLSNIYSDDDEANSVSNSSEDTPKIQNTNDSQNSAPG